jgi:hypothetical protein
MKLVQITLSQVSKKDHFTRVYHSSQWRSYKKILGRAKLKQSTENALKKPNQFF